MKKQITKSLYVVGIITTVAVLALQSAKAQISSISQVHQNFEYLDDQIPYSKIYLSTDKHYYLSTDTVFYQAFLTDSRTKLPIKRNVIGHVALLTKSDQIIDQAVVKITDGIGGGYFVPKRTIDTDEYVLVAYTESMKNFSSDFYFNKRLLFLNDCTPEKPSNGNISVKFFAEGGYFVEGATNKISFEVINEAGYPVSLSAVIKNSTNDATIPVTFDRNGIGTAMLNHIKGINYFLELSNENEQLKVDLPAFSDQGVALTMTSKPGFIEVKAILSQGFKSKNDSIHFLFHQGSTLMFSESAKINNLPGFVYKFPSENIPAGLSNLIILDSDLNMVSERLFFVAKEEVGMKTKIEIENDQIRMRAAVKAKVSLTKSLRQSLDADYSVCVFDKKLTEVYPDIEANLVTYMYLTSELNDRIYDPNFYLTKEGERHINNMLISKKGNRVDWKKVLSVNTKNRDIYFNRTALTFTGKATYEDNTPVSDSTLISFYMADYEALFETYTEKNGQVDVRMFLDYDGLRTTFYHAIPQKGEPQRPIRVTASVERPTISKERFFGRPAQFQTMLKLDRQLDNGDRQSVFDCNDYLLSYQKRNILNKDIYKSYHYYLTKDDTLNNKKKEEIDFFSGLSFKSDLKRDLDEYIAFRDMRQVAKEILHSVLIRKRKGTDRIRVYNREIMHTFDDDPLFVIDGFPTYDPSEFLNLNPANVQTVEVISSFANIAKFGNLGKNGIIMVKSKPDKLTENKGASILKFKGFQTKYSKSYPAYDDSSSSSIPDFRSSIYWSSFNKIGDSGSGNIKYFHSDDISEFVITIQGIVAETGEPFHNQVTYKVRPSQ